MRHIMYRSAGLAAVTMTLALAACDREPGKPSVAVREGNKAAIPTGPHGGRLLRDGAIGLELVIHEGDGDPPRFQAYVTDDGRPVSPTSVGLQVTLGRLGGEVNRLRFLPEGDHLVSDGVVDEPHSFDVDVAARINDRSHLWHYSSYEGRLRLSEADALAKGIRAETAGPQTLRVTKAVGGAVAEDRSEIQFNLNRSDMDDVRVGQTVEIATMDDHHVLGRAVVAAIRPPFEEGSRATVMTVKMPGGWPPLAAGTPMVGTVVVGDEPVPLAVRTTAIQHFRNFQVVLAKYGDTYEVRMLELGRQTPEWTEVKSGLKAGERYATGNIFALGSKLDKNSPATVHGH